MSLKEFAFIIRSMLAGRILLLALTVLPPQHRANHRIAIAMQHWIDGELEEIHNRKRKL
jgi:hypothetical protein